MLTRFALPFFSLTLVLPAALTAQQSDEENVFEMPEFVVSGERSTSYSATNTLTGTQLNTLLKDSPFSIEVFTEAFMRDTGSTDFREVLAYDSGLQLTNTIGTNEFGNYSLGIETDPRSINNAETDIVTRGFRAPTLKNGFFTQTRVDTINVARIERAAGPMSLLYGIGAITGVSNVLTKKPMEDRFTEFEVMGGSRSFWRGAMDTTGPIFKNDAHFVGYRLTTALQTQETLFPHEQKDSFFISPVVTWSYNRTTDLKFEIEHGDRSHSGDAQKDAADGDAGLLVQLLDIDGNPRFDSEGNPILVPSGSRETDEQATFLQDYLGLGRFVNLGGPDAYTDEKVTTYSAEATHRIGENFRILVAGVYEKYDLDSRFYPGAPSISVNVEDSDNPQRIVVYGIGETYSERITKQFRVTGLYSFELFGGTQNFVAGRQELSEYTENPFFGDSNSILAGPFAQSIPADGSVIRYRGEPLVPPQSLDYNWRWYQGHYLIYQGSFWNKRLLPVLGYRWDRTQTRYMRSNYMDDGSLAPLEDPLIGRGAVDGRDNGGVPFTETTPTIGLSVVVNDSFTVYGLYSEGVALPNVTQRDGFEQGFPPEFTRNKEVGIKFDFFEGKISGRVTYFNLDKTGGVRYSFYAPAPYRGNFDPSQPITFEFPVDTAANQQRLLAFFEHIGSTNPDGTIRRNPNGTIKIPDDIQSEVRPIPGGGGSRLILTVPYGDPDNPGTFDPSTGTANGQGYGEDLQSFYRVQQQLRYDGLSHHEISYLAGNNPGADRGAYHNFDEISEGFEFRLNFTPIRNWQNVFSYTYTTVEIQATFSNLAQNQLMLGIEPIFWALGNENFSDPTNPNSYTGSLGAGVSNNDTPSHAFTYWSKYSFTDGPLSGFDVRLGVRYQSERAAESPWGGSGSFVNAPDRGRGSTVKAPVPAYALFDFGLGYRWDWKGAYWTVQLNVRNLFDKRELTASSTNRLVAGGPVVTRFYLEPRDIRLSLRVDF